MTHFVGTVVLPVDQGEDSLNDFMKPFDEELEVPRYVKFTKAQAIEDTRREIQEYAKGTYAEYFKDPAAYEEKFPNVPEHINYLANEFPKKLTWSDEELFAEAVKYENDVDAEGNIYSTYNRDTIYDWFVIGGRWSGVFSETDRFTVKEWIEKIIREEGATVPPRVHVQSDKTVLRRGEEGWFGYTKDDFSELEWVKTILISLGNEDENSVVYFLDFHI